jgi:uncharacterized protein
MPTTARLTQLYIYPVKSLAGIAVESARVEVRGLEHDRRWMLIRPEDGRFLSQREHPRMALIGTAIEPDALVLFDRADPASRVRVPLEAGRQEGVIHSVTVWDDTLTGIPVSAEANAWLSAYLGASVCLVRQPDSAYRAADPRFAPEGQEVSYADGFPFLLIGEPSLHDLNTRLVDPVPMNRFRPNFVIHSENLTPYIEESWADFSIGNQAFRGVKPCGRCAIITTNQDTAVRLDEPLRTLASYRRVGNKVLFGQNVIWLGTDHDAWVHVGDPVMLATIPK